MQTTSTRFAPLLAAATALLALFAASTTIVLRQDDADFLDIASTSSARPHDAPNVTFV